jgi:hypothetical protein
MLDDDDDDDDEAEGFGTIFGANIYKIIIKLIKEMFNLKQFKLTFFGGGPPGVPRCLIIGRFICSFIQ